jgi:type IV pilus assembly protein PilV
MGLAAMQLTALRYNTDSYLRTQATVAAYDLIDRVRSNRTAWDSDQYVVADNNAALAKLSNYEACKSSTCGCNTTACANDKIALYDLGRWFRKYESVLPGSFDQHPTITRNNNQMTVTIFWQEREMTLQQKWVVEL